jgi:hypothetical protein
LSPLCSAFFVLTSGRFATTIQRSTPGQATARKLYLLRSYDHENRFNLSTEAALPVANFGPAETMQIWQIARAATAAPFYFREIIFRPAGSNNKIHYSDGGFGITNNPTAVGIHEIGIQYGDDCVGAVVSIGTAKADSQSGGHNARAHVEQAFEKATNPKEVHVNVKNQKSKYRYYARLNDEDGLNIPLDDWKPNRFSNKPGSKTVEHITNKFAVWLLDRKNLDQIQLCAKELVSRRIARTENRAQWERFALGIEHFVCISHDCVNEKFTRRRWFDSHWDDTHRETDDGHQYKVPRTVAWDYQAPRP